MTKNKIDLASNLSFGFEQTFTITDWWTDPGFTSTSDTPLKREKMLALAKELADELKGKYFESKDIWDHMQYEVADSSGKTLFYVTMDPGSIEVKTEPCLIDQIEALNYPLFIAAERAQVVPYRTWWYGIKGGTEGGCHVNMGGFTPETNPLKANPSLMVKYSAYIHNRPWLHYPFMSLDVGPEGNAMRMDEKENYDLVLQKFDEYNSLKDKLDAQETYEHFKECNLIANKSSFPSLFKFHQPLFLVEDRGQEAVRSARELYLVSNLRLKILNYLLTQDKVEPLKSIESLHQEKLTSFWLWDKFKEWSQKLEIQSEEYQVFFQRQFPKLSMGEAVPDNLFINEGRRPRVITDKVIKDGVVRSKTVDTSYKRLEIFSKNSDAIEIQVDGLEKFSSQQKSQDGHFYYYLDVKYNPQKPVMTIKQGPNLYKFNINDMMWTN